MNQKKLGNFQICVSVPLNYVLHELKILGKVHKEEQSNWWGSLIVGYLSVFQLFSFTSYIFILLQFFLFFSFTNFLLKLFPVFLMISPYYQLLMIYSQLATYTIYTIASYLIKGQIRKMLSSKSKYFSLRKKKGVATELFPGNLFYFPCSAQFRILSTWIVF